MWGNSRVLLTALLGAYEPHFGHLILAAARECCNFWGFTMVYLGLQIETSPTLGVFPSKVLMISNDLLMLMIKEKFRADPHLEGFINFETQFFLIFHCVSPMFHHFSQAFYSSWAASFHAPRPWAIDKRTSARACWKQRLKPDGTAVGQVLKNAAWSMA